MHIPVLALIIAALAAVAAGYCAVQAIIAAGSLPCGAQPEATLIAQWMAAAIGCQGGVVAALVFGALLGHAPRRPRVRKG